MLNGANGRIEKAGSRLLRILFSLQHTKTLTKMRDQREEQGKIKRNKRSGQRSAVLLATQQSNIQYFSDMSLRKVDSDDGSDGHVETAQNRSTQ
jgi:hypothetical protein